MRIAIAQLWQETNTLSPIATTRADFEQFGVLRGADVVERMADTNELGGFIQSLRAWPERPEIVGLVRLPAWPAGAATAETYNWLLAEITTALQAALPVDALLLALHGSLVAQGQPDVEGGVLAACRALLGSDVPLIATLDLHANVTPEMVRSADALVLYHTAPHVDVFETGQRGAKVLRRILVEGAKPVTALVKIPAVLPAQNANTEAQSGMSVDFKRKLQAFERRPEVLAAGLATVQPWLDIPGLGSAALVTTDGRPDLATSLSEEIAGDLWRRRREYLPELTSIADAVRAAHEAPDGLTVLSDAADATTSGAPGDSVWILQEALQYEWQRPVLVTLVAPQLVDLAERLGTGAPCDVELGGVRDNRFGTRLAFQGIVERVFEARFTLQGHLARNLAIDMGRCAVLRRGNICVICTTRSGPHFAPELFQAAGFDPFAAALLVAKSPCGFRAAYASRARQIFNVQSPGCAPTDFWNYPFSQISHPLWPWDEFDTWSPRAELFI